MLDTGHLMHYESGIENAGMERADFHLKKLQSMEIWASVSKRGMHLKSSRVRM